MNKVGFFWLGHALFVIALVLIAAFEELGENILWVCAIGVLTSCFLCGMLIGYSGEIAKKKK